MKFYGGVLGCIMKNWLNFGGEQKNTPTIIAVSWPDCGVCNDPVPLGLAFHHQGSTFINAYCQAAMNLSMHVVNPLQTWLIETEGNMGSVLAKEVCTL